MKLLYNYHMTKQMVDMAADSECTGVINRVELTALNKDGLEDALETLEYAKHRGLKYYQMINFAPYQEVVDMIGKHHLHNNESKPSCADLAWWRININRINQFNDTPVDGIFFDTEMYYFGDVPEIPDYGDFALDWFYSNQVPYLDWPIWFRKFWFAITGHKDDLINTQANCFSAMIFDVVSKIDIKTFGFFLWNNAPFYHALVKGLVAANKTIVVMPERTYDKSYTEAMELHDSVRKDLRWVSFDRLKIVPGIRLSANKIFMNQFNIADISKIKQNTDGVWFWNGQHAIDWETGVQPAQAFIRKI